MLMSSVKDSSVGSKAERKALRESNTPTSLSHSVTVDGGGGGEDGGEGREGGGEVA